MNNSPTDWSRLFRIACSLIDQVNSSEKIVDSWTFGGGTAMMIQINHRESHDVDIFIPDPQLLSFLDPAKHDFKFETAPTDYEGDGSRFQKIVFSGIGEIDFIASNKMTEPGSVETEVEGRKVLLETLPEIIAKKIYYRGASIKPRDIFDIAAAGQFQSDEIVKSLVPYREEVKIALQKITELNPEFVYSAINDLAIKPEYKKLSQNSIAKAKEILQAV